MNHSTRTVIVAPMTKRQPYPTRVSCRLKRKSGQLILDQLRTVDRLRLVRKLGSINSRTATKVLEVLQEMFAA